MDILSDQTIGPFISLAGAFLANDLPVLLEHVPMVLESWGTK
jgi:hypothetical protein